MIGFFERNPLYKVKWSFNFPTLKASDPNGVYYSFDNWNDFGFRTTYVLAAKIDGKNLGIIGRVKVSHFPYTGNELDFVSLVSGKFEDTIVSLGDRDYYEFITKYLNEQDLKIFLERMGDLAYHKDKLDQLILEDKRYLNSLGHGVIQDSLLRDHTVSEVKEQLHRMLINRGTYHEAYSISLYDESRNEIFCFNKDPLRKGYYPDTLYAVVGNNGAGKTFFIKKIINFFKNSNNYIENYFHDGSEIVQFKTMVVVSFSPFDSQFPPSEDNYHFVGIDYNCRLQNTNFSRQITHEIFQKVQKVWFAYQEKLCKILDKMPFDSALLRLKDKIIDMSLESHDIDNLSSGQKIILLSIVNLIITVSEKTLVIVDEPEIFLHPPLIKAYVRALEDIVRDGNGICLIATHSAIVLQEILHTNIKIIDYDINDHRQVFKTVEAKTFGESVGRINDVIFGTDLRNTGYYNIISKEANDSEIESLVPYFGNEAKLIYQVYRKNGDWNETNKSTNV